MSSRARVKLAEVFLNVKHSCLRKVLGLGNQNSPELSLRRAKEIMGEAWRTFKEIT